VHQQHAADALFLVLGRVQDGGTGLDMSRIDAGERNRADEGIVHDLEGEHRKRILVAWQPDHLGTGLHVDSLNRLAVNGRGKQIYNGVEQRLHAFVFEG
jgi:hypothetical protein